MKRMMKKKERRKKKKKRKEKTRKLCERKIGRKVNICTALLIGQLS